MSPEEDLFGNIRYADDTTLLGRNREDLSKMAEALKDESLKFSLEINNSKANAMKIHGEGDFIIQGEETIEVKHFKFLGSCVTSNGDRTMEIKTIR